MTRPMADLDCAEPIRLAPALRTGKKVPPDVTGLLAEDHRTVLLECYYRGRPVAEVARRLGVPPGTVKSRSHYALRALKLALEEMGVSA